MGQTPLWTTTTSDALGRTKTVQAPDNSTTTDNYFGSLSEIIDPAGKKKLYTHNALGNLVTVSEPDAAGNYTVFTNYTYDVAGRLRTISMNGGLQTRTFNYNAQNQLTSEVHPESGTTTYTYNAVGMVLTKTDARGNQVTFEYDSYNRMTRSYQSAGTGGHEKRFYYDTYPADPGANIYGRLAAIEWTPPGVSATWGGQWGTQTNSYKHVFGYTNYGALTRSKLTADSYYPDTSGAPITTVMEAQFTWTVQGEMATITYPNGRVLYNKFDSVGRLNGLSQVASPDIAMVTGTTYTTAGQLSTMSFSMAPTQAPYFPRTETRTYNNLLQLTGIRVADTAGPVKMDFTYNYAAGLNNGRITSEVNNLTNTTVSFTYDELVRLKTAVSTTGGTTDWGLQFGYDVYGNRTSQTVTAGTAPQSSFAFDNNNRMIGYSYDNNGNQLTIPDVPVATATYDADNRMSSWTKSGTVERYQYHPSGPRVWKQTNSAIYGVFYLYGPSGQLLFESAPLGGQKDYVYFGGRLLYNATGAAVYRDRLGSTRATESVGVLTPRNYYPFGEEIGTSPNDARKFADTYRDATTGLDYAINRSYSSGTGRFLSTDPDFCKDTPLHPQKWNRYLYVRNDPVNFNDPSGLCADPEPAPGQIEDEPNKDAKTVVEMYEDRVRQIGQAHLRASRLLQEDEICSDWLTGVLQTAARNAGRSNPESYTASRLLASVSNVNFDALGNFSTVRINRPEGTVGNFLNRNPQFAAVAVGNVVYLSHSFFDLASTLQQAVLVLHETAHAALGFDDLALARAAGYTGSDRDEASRYFSSRSAAVCHADLPGVFRDD